MCLFGKIKVNGVCMTRAEAQVAIERLNEDVKYLTAENKSKDVKIANLATELNASKQRERIANRLYNEEKSKNAKLREQLEDFSSRGKDGKFKKKSNPTQ